MDTPTTLNPLEAAAELRATMIRYLMSTYSLRSENLKRDFRDALSNNFPLTQGPYLQATPPYLKARTMRELVAERTLDELFLNLQEDSFPLDRPLYHHQVEAIQKLCQGRNLIISTGTGSGKTESFLIPILHRLLEETRSGSIDEPGVRALLLYPMNALANDQMKRLRRLMHPFPSITFGRFVGDTPNHMNPALDGFRLRFGHDPATNELICRDQMRSSPPHILLTNYAMLEYLLLRPEDTNLFDGPTNKHWRFIVLDEVHVYNGAQAAEVAMLLRRVRDRVNHSKRGKIQFVGTSATLGSGEADFPALAEYASQLFDETIEYERGDSDRQDIIYPRYEPSSVPKLTWELDPRYLVSLRDKIIQGANVSDVTELITESGGPVPLAGATVDSYLHDALGREVRVLELQQRLALGSVDVNQLLNELVHGLEDADQLTALIDLCVRARPVDSDSPLLPARYHFLIRALEGGFVCMSPKHPSEKPRLMLNRSQYCSACTSIGETSRIFDLGVCQRCGAEYLLGVLENDNGLDCLQAPGWSEAELLYLLIDHDGGPEEEDEDEAAIFDDESTSLLADERTLCTRCGALTEGTLSQCTCDSQLFIQVINARSTRKGAPLRKCLACSGRSPVAIISRFTTGQDAPVSVIATSLYQALPPSSDPNTAQKIGNGRKLLSFADSRQDAAFFAPYLDRTYARAIERRLIWEIVKQYKGEDPRYEDLVVPIRKLAEHSQVLDEDESALNNGNRVRSWLMREILAVDRRQSLDGVGLAEITVAIPKNCQVPPILEKLGLSNEEGMDLARVLLDTVRMQAAVYMPDGVEIKDPIFSPRNVATVIRAQGSSSGILGWSPTRNINRRLDYLNKLFRRRQIGADPREMLSGIWTNWLTGSNSPWSKVLLARHDSKSGTLHALDPTRISFLASQEGHYAYRCDQCRQIWWRSISGVCPTYLCPGTLNPLGNNPDHSDNHYLSLYTSLKSLGLRVEEHTAQLGSEYAGQLQQQFLDGDVNALSCSTTFELGVDVGEVQAVLMRNVPPSPANYVQRAGRAGRRTGSAALVVTFAQQRRHDLHYFNNPVAMIDGHVKAPIISLDNPQISRRHVHAIAFAAYERKHVMEGGEWHRYVETFFMPTNEDETSPVDTFIEWLRSRPSDLQESLLRTVPEHLHSKLGLEDWSWVDALLKEDDHLENHGWLERATSEVRRELLDIDEAINQTQRRIAEARVSRQDSQAQKLAGYLHAIFAVKKTLADRYLIDYLAQRVVLPKYGFPVDVVTLDVSRDNDKNTGQVDLSRDLRLGITEFAPGSKVVANKTIWETTGLRIPAGKALIDSVWATCDSCGRFRTLRGEDPRECPTCASVQVRESRSFVVPIFGFLGKQSDERPGEARPRREGLSEFNFSDYASVAPEFQQIILSRKTVSIRFSRQGQITVLNRGPGGQGFRICLSCGYSEQASVKRSPKQTRADHPRPGLGSRTCSSRLSNRHLGHQYLTDVVEIQLPIPMNTKEARSTMYALLGAMNTIGISQSDVDGTVQPNDNGNSPTIIIFDTVPGGAGHARRIADMLESLMSGALKLVDQCDCSEDTSCYGCLRSYMNQRYHAELARGDAKRILASLI